MRESDSESGIGEGKNVMAKGFFGEDVEDQRKGKSLLDRLDEDEGKGSSSGGNKNG